MKKTLRFRFSWKVTLVALVFSVGMVRAAFWQWDRHLQKEAYLVELEERISLPPTPLLELVNSTPDPTNLLHRRASVSGKYLFDYEVVLRNRKDESDGPGVHVITPMQIEGSEQYVLVNRGYLPFTVRGKDQRKPFHKPKTERFVGLIKSSDRVRFLAPNDPPAGEGRPWVDNWLRVNIAAMQKQLPFKVLPVFVEKMVTIDPEQSQSEIIKNSSGREEILFLSADSMKVSRGELDPNRDYPAPAHSTVVPTATHLAYVYEWSFMALLTLVIGIVLQLKRH